LNSGPILWAIPLTLFLLWVFFNIGSQELFAWAGFKPQSSWISASWVLGLQEWAAGAWPESVPILKKGVWKTEGNPKIILQRLS
jgi:hypothetical protein